MVRAAAKNYHRVAAVTDPSDYAEVAREIDAGGGCLGLGTRLRLARKAFRHTAEYDARISAYFEALSDADVRGTYTIRDGVR
jgi:phosphoribosylaminoimidazolecarboxamide formyltransferase/IMP cyclohydrolase